MKRKVISAVLALCVCISSNTAVYAWEDGVSLQDEGFSEESKSEQVISDDLDVTESDEEADDNNVTDGEEEAEGDDVTNNKEEVEDSGSTDSGSETGGNGSTDSGSETGGNGSTGSESETDGNGSTGSESGNGGSTGTNGDAGMNGGTDTNGDTVTNGSTDTNSDAGTNSSIPTLTQVYDAMIALKDQPAYKEGVTWTNDIPYTGSGYQWHGGTLGGVNITAVGCAAFAFVLSDAAFGSLPARMYAAGGFSYEDIKPGDILRVNGDSHTVIVLQVSDAGVIIAEGNYNSTVHWGRAISKAEVMSSTSHYITRYPEGYVSPDDPAADEVIGENGAGTLEGGLNWKLTKAGTLTISGSGAMPDFSSASEQPWSGYSSQIRSVVIADGVTSIGSCAFWNCGAFSAVIPNSVTAVGNSAFRVHSFQRENHR